MCYLKTGIRIYGKRTVCRYGHAAKVKKIILSLLPVFSLGWNALAAVL